MSNVNISERPGWVDLAHVTRPLDHEGEMPKFSDAELLACRGLLAAGQLRELAALRLISREGGGRDFTVRSLVRQINGGSQARIRALQEQGGVAAPVMVETDGRIIQGDGITIYARYEDTRVGLDSAA